MSYIQFLGIGGAGSNPNRKSPSILIQSDSGKYAVLDFSAFTYCTVAKLGFTNIDLIFISHRHADHIGGILNFIHSLEVDTIPTLNKNPLQKEKITILGFSDITKRILQLMRVGFPELPNWQPIKIEIMDYPSWQNYKWNEFILTGVKVRHTNVMENIMIKVTNTTTKTSFVYTGDIKPSASTFNKLLKLATGTQFIIGDISSPIAELSRDPKTLSHPNARFWGKFINKYQGDIYFVHTYGVDSNTKTRKYILKFAGLKLNSPVGKRLHFPKIGDRIPL